MNDVLKKFTIVFGVDTKPLEQGIKKSESTLLPQIQWLKILL